MICSIRFGVAAFRVPAAHSSAMRNDAMGNAHGPSPVHGVMQTRPGGTRRRERRSGHGCRLPPSPPLDRSESRMAGLRAREWILGRSGPAPSHPTRDASATVALCRSMLTYRCGGSAGIRTRLPVSSRGAAASWRDAAGHRAARRGGKYPPPRLPSTLASKGRGAWRGRRGFDLGGTVTIAGGPVRCLFRL